MILDAGLLWVLIAFVAVFGLVIGSFLNVVIYRVPAGMSISSPPSACPNCHQPIRSIDNIPIVSWLVLRAKCRGCGTPISSRYPLVEAGTAMFFTVVAVAALSGALGVASTRTTVSGAFVLVAFLYFAAITVALGLIDIDTHTLPNRIVLPAYLVAVALFVAASVVGVQFEALLRAGIGMAALWLAYAAMAFAYPGGMGFGDVKLAGVVGIFLGWSGWGALALGALAAFVLGGLYAVILIVLQRANRKSGIPFGPWMLAGAWLGIGVGNIAFPAYLSLFGLTAT